MAFRMLVSQQPSQKHGGGGGGPTTSSGLPQLRVQHKRTIEGKSSILMLKVLKAPPH
jgi:hypothetical protein